MKRCSALVLFILFFTTVTAQPFNRAELVFNDGSIKSGFAQSVLETKKKIKFKETEDGEKVTFLHAELKRVSYFFDTDTTILERHDYFPAIKAKKAQKDGWFLLLKKGYVSLYFARSTIGGGMSTNPATGQMQMNGTASFKEYYVVRPDETALMLVSVVASLNSNATFKMYAPIYFSDYPELAEKIKKKEYTYKDLEEVIDIYNAWIAAK
jgi:hypothetical protein